MEHAQDIPTSKSGRGPRLSAEDKRQRDSYLREFLPAIATFGIVLTVVLNTVDENTSGARLWVVTPVVPMLAAFSPACSQIWRVNAATEVLPAVPVTATSVSGWRG